MLYPSLICVIPLVRGDFGYPSSERLIVEVVLVSFLVKRWIVVALAKCLSLNCEVNFVVAFVPCLCERLYSVKRGVVYSWLYCPKSSVEVPCVGVLCGQVSENPSV